MGFNQMKRDIGLVIGGKIPDKARPFLAEIERCFPGALRDAVITVRKPKAEFNARSPIGLRNPREKVTRYALY